MRKRHSSGGHPGRNESGATAVEYALMVGLIGIGIITAVSTLKDQVGASLNTSACSMPGSGGGVAIPISSGWSTISGDVDIVNYWPSPTEALAMDLNGSTPGTVTRNLATTIGQSYCVTYWLAGNPHGAPTQKTLSVSAGSATQNLSFDSSGRSNGNMGWTQKSIKFEATATSTPLTFASTTPSSPFGPAIAGISFG